MLPDEALPRLVMRAARVRLVVGFSLAIVGVVAGLGGYWFVYRTFFVGTTMIAYGIGITIFCVAVGFVPPVLICLTLARRLWRRIIRRRTPTWIADIAAEHHVPPDSLSELADLIE